MLTKKSYPREYVAGCRSKIERQLAAYRDLATAASDDAASTALGSFEPEFFNNLVIVLEGYFVHRTRAVEKKDGNPLNEVRVLCNSLMLHDGVFTAEPSIRLDPSTSVLEHRPGDSIRLREADFRALADAFLAELERKYVHSNELA